MKISVKLPWAASISLLLMGMAGIASAQDSLRYFRIHLRDKGTPARVLHPGDSSYAAAASLLTPRSLARRAKVLPPESLITTDDLPIYAPYLNAIKGTGATVAQMSRWLNAVMVFTDSAHYEIIKAFPFVDSVIVMRIKRAPPAPFGKFSEREQTAGASSTGASSSTLISSPGCLTGHYGRAAAQNNFTRVDLANARGFAGEGIFVGVLDAGFDWHKVAALRNAHVVAEYDFVNHDSNVASDQAGERQDPLEPVGWHGTLVSSIIGGYQPDQVIGGAPNVEFAFAKTEDVFSEHHVEEDNFVAGLEWLESLGVDVTNTSLGYTTFDSPETGHTYEELDGHTTFGARGLNHAVSLGMACVVAAGNEAGGYNYIGVPAEADSAIAVAAVFSDSSVTDFSSRGFGGRARLKPDVATLGVAVYGSDANDSTHITSARGTSLASPLVTAAAAVILSAAPELTPYELRTLFYRTSGRSYAPDTAVGYGVINVERALDSVSLRRPIAGVPQIYTYQDSLMISSWTEYLGYPGGGATAPYLRMRLSKVIDGHIVEQESRQAIRGLSTWTIPLRSSDMTLAEGDSIVIDLISVVTGQIVRETGARLTADFALPVSTLCNDVPANMAQPLYVEPNPTTGAATLGFTLERSSNVSLAVYNSIGQEVDRPIDGEQLAQGGHKILWNPTGLASGAYFFSLTIDGATSMQKLMLFHQ